MVVDSFARYNGVICQNWKQVTETLLALVDKMPFDEEIEILNQISTPSERQAHARQVARDMPHAKKAVEQVMTAQWPKFVDTGLCDYTFQGPIVEGLGITVTRLNSGLWLRCRFQHIVSLDEPKVSERIPEAWYIDKAALEFGVEFDNTDIRQFTSLSTRAFARYLELQLKPQPTTEPQVEFVLARVGTVEIVCSTDQPVNWRVEGEVLHFDPLYRVKVVVRHLSHLPLSDAFRLGNAVRWLAATQMDHIEFLD